MKGGVGQSRFFRFIAAIAEEDEGVPIRLQSRTRLEDIYNGGLETDGRPRRKDGRTRDSRVRIVPTGCRSRERSRLGGRRGGEAGTLDLGVFRGAHDGLGPGELRFDDRIHDTLFFLIRSPFPASRDR